jgi:MATE family multidrug resistance protein
LGGFVPNPGEYLSETLFVTSSLPHTELDEPRWAGLSEVLRMAWPIILGSMSWTVMQFVDNVMLGHLGTAPLAAGGSAGVWAWTMNTFILGVVGCVSTFASQSLGKGRPEDCAKYAWQGIYLSIAAGALVFVLWPLSGPLFRSMGHSEEVTRLEIVYFRVRLFGYVFIAWQTALAAYFQAVNRPQFPMYASIIANAINAVLAYLLIFGKFGFPRWEVRGAATATVIALGLQVVMLQAVFFGKGMHAAYATRTSYAFDARKVRELLRIGGPAGIMFFLDIFNWSVFTGFIVGHFGEKSLAAHNAAVSLMHMSFMPAVGLNNAIAPIVGQWIGRGRIDRAKARTYTAMKLAMGYMFVMGIVFGVFGGVMVRGFFSADGEVISIGHWLLIFAAVFQGFDAVNITVSGALRGAGDTRWMAVVTAIFAYAVFLPAALLFAFVLKGGAVGAWIGATIYVVGLSGLLFGRFHGERWRHINIFAARPEPEDIATVPEYAPGPET